MQKTILYRYARSDGGITVSPIKPDVDYTQICRLVADEGHALTDGNITTQCIDTYEPDMWTEIKIM